MIGMHFEGGTELAAAFGTLSTRVTKAVWTAALVEGGAPVRHHARRGAPRAPGAPDLADHIEIMPVRGGYEGDPAVAVGPTKEVFYGSFQEIGTSRHAAQPFLRPAIDTERRTALQIVGAAMWRELAGRGIGRVISVPSMPESGGRFL